MRGWGVAASFVVLVAYWTVMSSAALLSSQRQWGGTGQRAGCADDSTRPGFARVFVSSPVGASMLGSEL